MPTVTPNMAALQQRSGRQINSSGRAGYSTAINQRRDQAEDSLPTRTVILPDTETLSTPGQRERLRDATYSSSVYVILYADA